MSVKKMQQIPQIHYETSRLNDDIPIKDVISMYTSVNPNGRGGSIHCPSPEHTDKKPSAHIYGNHCYCFSCGKSLKPLDLASECFPELSFPNICEKLIQDFGLNVYEYSNQAEIDAVKNAKSKNQFVECFPVTETDLNLIGLHNPNQHEEIFYSVKATTYFEKTFGEIPPNAEVYDSQGRELLIQCTRGEMIEMDFIAPTEKENKEGIERHQYHEKMPTLREIWIDDKKGVEEMIIGKCYERMECINGYIAPLQAEINAYKATHDVNQIKEAELYRKAYEKALSEFKEVKLSPAQEEKINGLNSFEENKDDLRFLNGELDKVDFVLHKVLNYEKQREQAKKRSWGKNEVGD